MSEGKNDDQALRWAVIQDGEQDLLGAYRLIDCAVRNAQAAHPRELEGLERAQAIVGLVIYAALKTIRMEELDPRMQAVAQAIQQQGLTRFVRSPVDSKGH